MLINRTFFLNYLFYLCFVDFSSKFSPPLPKVVSEGDPSKKNDYFGSNFHFNKTTAFGTIGGNKSSHASQNYISGHQYQDFTSVANDRVKESFIGNTLTRTFFSKKSLFTNSGNCISLLL